VFTPHLNWKAYAAYNQEAHATYNFNCHEEDECLLKATDRYVH